MTQTLEQPQTGNNGGELATRQAPNMMLPIGSSRNPQDSSRTLKGLLEAMKGSIAAVLPKHVTPERLIKTLMVAANRNPKLFDCTRMSIIETVSRAGELGLDLSGTLGEAYPVPYGTTCQMIIGFRGFAKLARQSGEIKSIDADVVHVNDKFIFRKGKNAEFTFAPNLLGDRGKPVGAYAYVTFKDGGEQFDFMTVADIEKIRARSRSGNNGPWVTDWNEMAKKTVFRRLAKWLPMSTEAAQKAMEEDNKDFDFTEVVEAETTRPRGAAALANKLKQRGEPGEITDPLGEPIEVVEPASEEEAERILQESAAKTRGASGSQSQQPASPSDSAHESSEGGGAQEGDSQAPDAFEQFKITCFEAMEANKLSQSEAESAWAAMLVANRCKGKEHKLPKEAWPGIIAAAAEGRGVFVKT